MAVYRAIRGDKAVLWLLILLGLLVIGLEVPGLWKQKLYKELLVFGLFFGLSMFLGLAQLYGWHLYNPFMGILKIMES
ncbi:hypothetical protein [Syntrophomonas palmitatica]|uniref:hypothetical protein n=1 Tax=Syntrophomonas palmitatica TaxID=402877 RepID=UPI0006D11795|nr:hypothetical protein [Syntrophomonas palmitatica]